MFISVTKRTVKYIHNRYKIRQNSRIFLQTYNTYYTYGATRPMLNTIETT